MPAWLQKFLDMYTFSTVPGTWLIVMSFIASIVVMVLLIRVLFPIKPTPLSVQEADTAFQALGATIGLDAELEALTAAAETDESNKLIRKEK